MSDIFKNLEIANIIKIIHTLNNPKAIAKAKANPIEFFDEHGVFLPKNMEYEIHLNDSQYFYFVILSSPNATMSEEQMNNVTAAKAQSACLSSASSLSSAGSFSCPLTSSSTVSCGSTASTAEVKSKIHDSNPIMI